jgi:two-component system chemotaxis response regulator CheY
MNGAMDGKIHGGPYDGAHDLAMPAVLVVDDDDDCRVACQLILEMEGYRTVTACSGEAALRALRLRPQVIGLIVLDLMMPRMNGGDFLALKARVEGLARVPVVVLSATPEAGRALDSDDVKAVLAKPVRLAELLDAVGRWVATREVPRH